MLSFSEITRKTDKVLKIIDSLKKDTISDIFDEYAVEEKIKKILEQKQISLGSLTTQKIVKQIMDKKEINYDVYSIAIELDILKRLINRKIVRQEKYEKISQNFLSFDKLKEKIKNIGKDKKNLYIFLDEYLLFLLKKKNIFLSDFNRRQLILKLCDRKAVKLEKYQLSKTDLATLIP